MLVCLIFVQSVIDIFSSFNKNQNLNFNASYLKSYLNFFNILFLVHRNISKNYLLHKKDRSGFKRKKNLWNTNLNRSNKTSGFCKGRKTQVFNTVVASCERKLEY